MNLGLLLKHLSKLHDSGNSPAHSYLINNYGWSPVRDLGSPSLSSTPVWQDIFKGLDFFRSITNVIIGNGSTTSFWADLWIPNSERTLAQQFPALFSHSLSQSASVARVLDSPNLTLTLAPRLSHAAESELAQLRAIMASINLNSQVTDRRIGRHDGKPLTAKSAYQALWAARPTDPLAMAIWKNYAPNKCRIFIWLAHKDRVFTNDRRFRHSIATSDAYPFCGVRESIDRLLFQCCHLQPLWDELQSLYAGGLQICSLSGLGLHLIRFAQL